MIDLNAELRGSYQILPDSGDGIFGVKLSPSVSWSYFHGHFPSMPILPAVGILDISRYFIETYIQKEAVRFSKLSFFKIKTPVHPEQVLIVSIQKESSNRFQVIWKNETENSISAEFFVELN